MDISRFADIELPDPDGAPHRLGDYWQKQRTVIVLLRHFG